MHKSIHRNKRRRQQFALGLVSMSLAVVALLLFHHRIPGAKRDNPNIADRNAALKKYAAIPLYFERNEGQTDESVRYLSHTSRSSLYLTDDAAVITMVGGAVHKGRFATPKDAANDQLVESAVRIRLVGANAHPQFEALDPFPGRVNYLVGNDPSKYHRNVPIFGRIREKNVYPGIDLVYYGRPDALEYDLIAAPGADTSKLKFAIEGGHQTTIDANGNLIVSAPAGKLMIQKPRVFQQDARGDEKPIDGAFMMAGDGTMERGIARREIAFSLASYDHSKTLRIDPVFRPAATTQQIVYSTYLGGSGSSSGPFFQQEISDMSGGNIALQVADGGTDVAVDKVTGKAYVTGIAYSNDFPTSTTPFIGVLAGANSPPAQNPNAFVSEIDPSKSFSASLVFSTYLGGSGDISPPDAGKGYGDFASGIAEDVGGNTYIVGQTFSEDFPDSSLCGAFGQNDPHTAPDTGTGFIAKLSSDGSSLTYACYIGGHHRSIESKVALQPSGCGNPMPCQAYMVGSTSSGATDGFPVTVGTAFQENFVGGNTNAATFVALAGDAQSLVYSTLYGGSGDEGPGESGLAIVINILSSDAFITGSTFSTDLPVKNAQISSYPGAVNKTSNAFVAQFRPSETGALSLQYATYLGGSGAKINHPDFAYRVGDVGTAITYDTSTSKVWVTGYTASTDFPTGPLPTTFQSTNQAATNSGSPATAAFLTELDPFTAGPSGIVYSTYFSGAGTSIDTGMGSVGFGDAATGIALISGANVKIFITGITTSGTNGDFPLTPNACGQVNSSSGLSFGGGKLPVTSFAAVLDPGNPLPANQLTFSTLLGGSGTADLAEGLGLASPFMVIAGTTYSNDFPVTAGAFQSTNATTGSSQVFLTELNPSGTDCLATATTTATATATATATETATATATASETPTETATATESATETATATATATVTETATATATDTATVTATETATATLTATATDTPTQTTTATTTPSPAPTATATPTAIPTATLTATAAATPTTTATSLATDTPTATSMATATATALPTGSATIAPTGVETPTPSPAPTPAGMVDIIQPASGGGKPGDNVDAGSFGYTPTDTTDSQVISSVTVSVTHPRIFSSLTLTAFLDTVPAGTVEVDAPNITSSTVFTFSPVITIPSGGSHSLTFSFSGVISGKTMGAIDLDKVQLAGIGLGLGTPTPSGGWLMLSLSLLGILIVPLGYSQRRRVAIVVGAILIMGATLAGCGGGSAGGSVGQPANASTQEVVAVDVSVNGNAVGVGNLPIDLGTLHKH